MKIPSDSKVSPNGEVEICFNLDKLLFFDSKTQKSIK